MHHIGFRFNSVEPNNVKMRSRFNLKPRRQLVKKILLSIQHKPQQVKIRICAGTFLFNLFTSMFAALTSPR